MASKIRKPEFAIGVLCGRAFSVRPLLSDMSGLATRKITHAAQH